MSLLHWGPQKHKGQLPMPVLISTSFLGFRYPRTARPWSPCWETLGNNSCPSAASKERGRQRCMVPLYSNGSSRGWFSTSLLVGFPSLPRKPVGKFPKHLGVQFLHSHLGTQSGGYRVKKSKLILCQWGTCSWALHQCDSDLLGGLSETGFLSQ